MALETHIHKEITDYKARVVGDLSSRQLLCLVGTAAMIAISYFILVRLLHLSMDWYPYVAMLLCAPILLFGFKTKGKLSFEQYMQLLIRHNFGKNKLTWAAEYTCCNLSLPKEVEKQPEIKKGKKGEKSAKAFKKANKRNQEEAEEYSFGGKKEVKAARKRVQEEIKKAKRGYQ